MDPSPYALSFLWAGIDYTKYPRLPGDWIGRYDMDLSSIKFNVRFSVTVV